MILINITKICFLSLLFLFQCNAFSIPSNIKNNFKVKSNSSNFESDYKENFVKLIENFLLLHLKKIVQKQKLTENDEEISQNHNQNFDKFITKFSSSNSTLPSYSEALSSTIIPNGENKCKHNETNCNSEFLNFIKLTNQPTKNDNGFYEKLKYALSYYKNYFFYFISIIILLSTLSFILVVILVFSCVFNYKQRARLSLFSENEFFTYYNRNIPTIASVSSFSLTETNKSSSNKMNPKPN